MSNVGSVSGANALLMAAVKRYQVSETERKEAWTGEDALVLILEEIGYAGDSDQIRASAATWLQAATKHISAILKDLDDSDEE